MCFILWFSFKNIKHNKDPIDPTKIFIYEINCNWYKKLPTLHKLSIKSAYYTNVWYINLFECSFIVFKV